jgi:predicted AlkP superfamily phosphohydrolase/phosphomutase
MEDLINLIEKRVMVCENLMNNYSWDFFMVVFTALDRLQHYYWKYIDKNHIGYDNEESRILFPSILKVYQKIDEAIGRLSRIKEKSIGDGNIIIYSDHGFKPLNAYFFTNSFFRQNELIKIRKKSFNSIINQHYIVNKIPYYLIKLLQNFPLRIRRKVTNYIQPTKDYIDIFSLPSSTKALHFGNGFIKINLDKESQEYEDIRSLIMNFFNNEFQNGELIKAYKREEIYSGICIDSIPDIILQVKGDIFPTQFIPVSGIQLMKFNEDSDIPSLRWSGQHDMKGIIICNGSNFATNSRIKDANIIDITPTIINTLEKSIPYYMEGKIIEVSQ